MPSDEHAYSLTLADGAVWTFTTPAGEPFEPWLDEFGRILRLGKDPDRNGPGRRSGRGSENQNGERNTIARGFVRIIPFDKTRRPEGPDDSWTSYTQGSAYRAWISSRMDEAVLEIEPSFIDHPEIRYIDMSAALRIVFRLCLSSGSGCSLHAASAALDGTGVIITASGHTGKSTCHDRFPAPWKPLADDAVLAVRNPAGGFSIQPMPTWSDYLRKKKNSTFETGTAYPLKALFFLEQDETDAVKPVTPAVAAGILHRLSREAWAGFLGRLGKDEKKRLDRALFDISCTIANAAPGFILQATLHGEFWKEIEKVL